MGCALAALLLAFPMRAGAQPALDIALELRAPGDASCIGAGELRKTVEERVGSIVFLNAENVERTIRVHIGRASTGAGFGAELTLVDTEGRSLGARSVQTNEQECRALDPALVLVISTLVGIAREPEARVAPEPEPEPEAQPPAVSRNDVAAAPRFVAEPALREPVVRWRVSLGVGAQAALGLLPGFAPLGALDLLTRRGAFVARLGMAAAPYAQSDLDQGARASFRALHASLSLCGIATDRALGPLAFCAGASGGALAAETSGLYQNARTVEPYVLLNAGPTLELPVARAHAVRLGVSAFLPVLAPRYYYVERNESRRYYHAVELGLLVEIGWLCHLLS